MSRGVLKASSSGTMCPQTLSSPSPLSRPSLLTQIKGTEGLGSLSSQAWEPIQGEIKGRLPRSPSSNFSSVNSHGARIVHLRAPLLISWNPASALRVSLLSRGCEPIITAYLSRPQGAHLPLLSTKPWCATNILFSPHCFLSVAVSPCY